MAPPRRPDLRPRARRLGRPLAAGDDLSPPDPRGLGITCAPKELLDGAPAVQGTDRESFTQVAHTTRIGPPITSNPAGFRP